MELGEKREWEDGRLVKDSLLERIVISSRLWKRKEEENEKRREWIRFCELCSSIQFKFMHIESCIELRLTKERWRVLRVKFCEQIYSEKIVIGKLKVHRLKCIELSLSFAKMTTELRRREWIRILYKFIFFRFYEDEFDVWFCELYKVETTRVKRGEFDFA